MRIPIPIFRNEVTISKDNYVRWNIEEDRPVDQLDVIYHHSTVISYYNANEPIPDNVMFVRMIDLPISWQHRYINYIASHQNN